MKGVFKVKQKAFFIFQQPVVKNCLRPESAPLTLETSIIVTLDQEFCRCA